MFWVVNVQLRSTSACETRGRGAHSRHNLFSPLMLLIVVIVLTAMSIVIIVNVLQVGSLSKFITGFTSYFVLLLVANFVADFTYATQLPQLWCSVLQDSDALLTFLQDGDLARQEVSHLQRC